MRVRGREIDKTVMSDPDDMKGSQLKRGKLVERNRKTGLELMDVIRQS